MTAEQCPFPHPTSVSSTKQEILDYIWWHFERGILIDCPVCTQSVKKYPRRLTGLMVEQLQFMAASGSWVHSHEIANSTPHVKAASGATRTFSLMRHWGLIESGENHHWRITRIGRDFLIGATSVPKYVFLFNDAKVSESDECIMVDEVRGRFDMAETMDPKTVQQHDPSRK